MQQRVCLWLALVLSVACGGGGSGSSANFDDDGYPDSSDDLPPPDALPPDSNQPPPDPLDTGSHTTDPPDDGGGGPNDACRRICMAAAQRSCELTGPACESACRENQVTGPCAATNEALGECLGRNACPEELTDPANILAIATASCPNELAAALACENM